MTRTSLTIAAVASLFAFSLTACDAPNANGANTARATPDATTGSHISGTDTGAVGSSDTHWIEQAQRNNSHF